MNSGSWKDLQSTKGGNRRMATKTVYLQQLQGIAFATKGDSNHWVTMDGPAEFDGTGAATRPKELLLMALAGCTASDVVNILKKKRAGMTGFEMFLRGEESEVHPKVFTGIHIEYVVHGNDIDPVDVERAIELSTTKYCSVSAMLSPKVTITHSFRIVNPDGVPSVVGD